MCLVDAGGVGALRELAADRNSWMTRSVSGSARTCDDPRTHSCRPQRAQNPAKWKHSKPGAGKRGSDSMARHAARAAYVTHLLEREGGVGIICDKLARGGFVVKAY